MKRFLLSVVVCGLACIGCSECPSYDDAISDIEDVESFEEFARFVLETEGQVVGAAAKCYGEDLPPEFIVSRDSFYSIVDKRIAEYRVGHFVELRTVLYEQAAAVLGTLENAQAADAVTALLKRCSAALYIDGQRVCDPPKSVRERYEKAKRKCEK